MTISCKVIVKKIKLPIGSLWEFILFCSYGSFCVCINLGVLTQALHYARVHTRHLCSAARAQQLLRPFQVFVQYLILTQRTLWKIFSGAVFLLSILLCELRSAKQGLSAHNFTWRTCHVSAKQWVLKICLRVIRTRLSQFHEYVA